MKRLAYFLKRVSFRDIKNINYFEINRCLGIVIVILLIDWLRFLAVDFIHKFGENIDKFFVLNLMRA